MGNFDLEGMMGRTVGDRWKVVEWVIINYAYKGCYSSSCDLLG